MRTFSYQQELIPNILLHYTDNIMQNIVFKKKIQTHLDL